MRVDSPNEPSDRELLGFRSSSLVDLLSDPRRRLVVSVLGDRAAPVGEGRLAALVGARERSVPPEELNEERRRDVQLTLCHKHLPSLADAGAVERDHHDRVVLTDRSIPRLVERVERLDDDEWAVLSTLLSSGCKRAILSVLAGEDAPVPVDRLAESVVERDPQTDDGSRERVVASLRHVHLPALAEADLVEYDPTAGTVAYTDTVALREEWLSPDLTLREALGAGNAGTA